MPAGSVARGKAVAAGSLLLVMLVWGSTFVVTKSTLDEVPPFLLALLRFGIASAILVPLAIAAGHRLPRPVPWPSLALLGLTGVTLYFVGFNLSLDYTTASDGALIQGSNPAMTGVLAAIVLRERLTLPRILGLAGSLLGVALVVLAGAGNDNAPNRLLGDLVMLGAVVAWTTYTVVGKRLRGVSPLAVTAASTLLGTLFLVPPALYDLIARPPATVSWRGWLAVGYLGVVASALCYLLWNRALAALDATQTATFLNLIPVVGVAGAALFLDETLSALQLAGGGLVLLGVAFSVRGEADADQGHVRLARPRSSG